MKGHKPLKTITNITFSVLGLLFVGAGLALVQPCMAAPFEWQATGSLTTSSVFHSATLLTDGKVLVVGGSRPNGASLARSEVYDPATGTWAHSGNLAQSRTLHTATLLRDGRVLVAAGFNTSLPIRHHQLNSAELSAPANGKWTSTGSLATARSLHTATLLPDGRVLVAGGYNFLTPLASCEIYDPASGTWTATGSLHQGRGR